jgi:hypothetical protein
MLKKLMPRPLCDTPHLMIGQHAAPQYVCQHFAESSALVPWD